MLSDVAQEKQHNALLHGVEQFETSSLRKTETVEKNVLPNALGIVWWSDITNVPVKFAETWSK